MIESSGCRVRYIKEAKKLIGSIMVKDYYSNINQIEIKVYGNDNECIYTKKQLCSVKKKKKNTRETKNKVKSTGKSENLIIKQKHIITQPADK